MTESGDQNLLIRLQSLEPLIGNTPLIHLNSESMNLFTKLEYQNLTGSVKARPAYYVLKKAIERGDIHSHTTVIESSSGNFALALATFCNYLGLRFIPVIDPNINPIYEANLRLLTSCVEKVTERDVTQGYLLSRLDRVSHLRNTLKHCFWTNQYANPDCVASHYYGLGEEIANAFTQLDYAFIGVGSGGTIAGTSKKLKEKFKNIKIIAIDTEGSVIFGGCPQKRYIPGIGSSIVPANLSEALIDEILMISERDAVRGCEELLNKHSIFAGGSTGSVYSAITGYFTRNVPKNDPNVVFICADSGMPYLQTVYNTEWQDNLRTAVKS